MNPTCPTSPTPSGLSFVELHDGRPGLRTTIPVEIRMSSSHESRITDHAEIGDNSCNSCHTLDFISSDESLDRYGEIISASGWRLDTYRKNPVFQNAHQYGDIIFTLGRAEFTEVRAGKLYQRIRFATDVNPMAKIAYGLYQGKFLNAVSVGFIPIRWEDPNDNSRGFPSPGGEGQGEGERFRHSSSSSSSSSCSIPRRRYLEQELLEVSAVAIPANPNALALGLKSGAIQKSDLEETADLLRHFLSITPISPISPIQETVHLVRQLRDLLKHT